MSKRSEERQELLRDVAVCAVEGGINYWARVRRYKWSSVSPASLDHMLPFPVIEISPAEDPDDFEPCKIGEQIIVKGLRMICSAEGKELINAENRKMILEANIDNDASNIDADLADAIVQVGLFGKLVFG